MVKKINSVTEKKIKQAAKEVFLKKWLSWSRTREITEKAWVNLALLNYYFGWKEELYNIVMFEMLEEFQWVILKILNDKDTTFEEKMRIFTDNYYDSIIANPKVFPFILDVMRQNIDNIKKKIETWNWSFNKTYFAKQYMETTWKSLDDFRDFFINFLWLIAFPVVWAPLFTVFFELKEKEYYDFLIRRKKFIFNIIPHLY